MRATPWTAYPKRQSEGRWLCRWCSKPLAGGRNTSFCSRDCEREVRIRCEPSSASRYVFERDRGLCASCGLDAPDFKRRMATLRDRTRALRGPFYRASSEIFGQLVAAGFPYEFSRAWWEADHVVPVVEGGGGCGLENYRTLCVPCHKRATAALAAKRAAKRAAQRRRDRELPLFAEPRP